MANFFQKSLEELDHVVWPTHTETKKYMHYTVGTIIVMAIFLSILGYMLSESMKAVRSQFPHTPPQIITTSGSTSDLEKDIQKIINSASGTSSTGAKEKILNVLSGALSGSGN